MMFIVVFLRVGFPIAMAGLGYPRYERGLGRAHAGEAHLSTILATVAMRQGRGDDARGCSSRSPRCRQRSSR